jgi:hypothetical protein
LEGEHASVLLRLLSDIAKESQNFNTILIRRGEELSPTEIEFPTAGNPAQNQQREGKQKRDLPRT